ncbi:DUF3602 domain-containing protein [Microdochium nivale]|nr:DUF3602 domain-containing protein [Microdochium nivale]
MLDYARPYIYLHSTSVVLPAAPTTSAKPASSRFYSGRGGAGNAHSKAERPVLCFDEEFARHAAQEQKLRGHVGRGGAGNAYSKPEGAEGPVVRKGSDASSHRSSSSSSSVRSGFFARLGKVSSKN